jgi:glucose-6-phosphate-specific signal transduction histidine kinase
MRTRHHMLTTKTIYRDITERKRDEEMRRTFSQRLIGAQEAERRRVARELHDETGQVLTAIEVNLENIQAADASARAAQLTDRILIIDRAVRRLRELALD